MKIKDTIINGAIILGSIIGINKCTDWYLHGALPDLKKTADWKEYHLDNLETTYYIPRCTR